ncbi:MAG: ABC transporter ATP-binding protein [Xanthobacteraceae bacterium]|nr:ABC transporter ATP-binding protein [Xanthobacteraceae bacterium]
MSPETPLNRATSAVAISHVGLNYLTPEKETVALRDINLQLAAGEFVALVGPSGCGKSTLLTLISGLAKPSQGRITINGKDITGPTPRVGFMFQRDTLFEWRTVLDNVLLGAELLNLPAKASRERAEELLTRYGLRDFMHSKPNHLSGGMRQRVALARTMLPKPELLLLDEPFSALDYQTRLALSDEMSVILRQEGKTVVLVTHDIGEAVSMADRVIVMSRRPGRVKSEHEIVYPGTKRPTPFAARSTAEFNAYFKTIWDELDLQESDQRLVS